MSTHSALIFSQENILGSHTHIHTWHHHTIYCISVIWYVLCGYSSIDVSVPWKTILSLYVLYVPNIYYLNIPVLPRGAQCILLCSLYEALSNNVIIALIFIDLKVVRHHHYHNPKGNRHLNTSDWRYNLLVPLGLILWSSRTQSHSTN